MLTQKAAWQFYAALDRAAGVPAQGRRRELNPATTVIKEIVDDSGMQIANRPQPGEGRKLILKLLQCSHRKPA